MIQLPVLLSLLALPAVQPGGVAPALAPASQTPGELAKPFLGPWKQVGGSDWLHFDETRCIAYRGGSQVLFLMDWKPGEVRRRLAYDGARVPGTLSLDQGQLVVGATETTPEKRFERADEVAECLRIDPYDLGSRVPSPEEIEELVFEFDLRHKDDQDVRHRVGDLRSKAQAAGKLGTREKEIEFQRSPEMQALMQEMRDIDSDNTERLVELVQDIGWISRERFGEASNQAAFLIVQHSGDLRLMRAALPLIEREARGNPRQGQHYALLWDRTQLRLGNSQRYGSQLVGGPDGGLCVVRLEDPEKVNERRAEMGMGPLEEYLALFRTDGTKAEICDPKQ